MARTTIFALRQADTGVAVAEVCREMRIREATARAAGADYFEYTR